MTERRKTIKQRQFTIGRPKLQLQQRLNLAAWALLAGSATLLTACGGGGGGGGSTGGGSVTPPSNGGGGTGGGGGGGGGGTPVMTGNAVADAGDNQTVSRFDQVTLDGSSSSDPDGDPITYSWRQVLGPDVTDGSGALQGAQPSFAAPEKVSTLVFELTVSDGSGFASAPDEVLVQVLENEQGALFVDGDNGSDDGAAGTASDPYASISYAIDQIEDDEDVDIYVKTLAAEERYDETSDTLTLPARTSLYGGYGENWIRDVTANPTALDGSSAAVSFSDVSEMSWFSGFDLATADGSNASSVVVGVSVSSGDGTLYIEDNQIVAGDVGEGNSTTPASSYGLRLAGVSAVRVSNNTIVAGRGAPGNSGSSGTLRTGEDGGDAGNGGQGGNENGGSGGSASSRDSRFNFSNAGGRGGTGGTNFNERGNSGGAGDSVRGVDLGGSGGSGAEGTGAPGDGGSAGTGGLGGTGADGVGELSDSGFYRTAQGTAGAFGEPGTGGGGGGGGGASLTGFDGGGGGGGGGGGAGGRGSSSAVSGGASIGISLAVSDAVIDNNIISAGDGGQGGNARGGAFGGDGGSGGSPGAGASSNSGNGGWGGGGGSGAQGGQGGGGGGGPSFAIMVAEDTMPVINNNQLTSGTGGNSGGGSAHGLNGRSGAFGGAVNARGDSGGKCCTTTTPNAAQTFAQGGFSFGIFDEDTADGASPSLDNNSFTVGTAGSGASTGGRDGLSGETNF